MILAPAAWALLAAASPQTADVTGSYLASQMEMAGALELRRDGRFRYQLEYGAVSESAEGDWTFDGNTVELTSNPMPKPPDFALVSDEAAPPGELYVALEDTGLSWTPISVLVLAEGSEHFVRIDAEDNGRVVIPQGRRAALVRMLLPVYGTAGTAVSLSPERGHRLLFRIQANDFGKAAFHGEALLLEGTSLVLHRYGTAIAFRRAKP